MVGFGIADALNDRDHSLIVQVFERTHLRIESDVRVDPKHIALRDRKTRPQLIILWVAMWNDAVESVVSALQIDDNEHSVRPGRQTRQRRLCECACKHIIHVRYDRYTRDSTEEKSTAFHHIRVILSLSKG